MHAFRHKRHKSNTGSNDGANSRSNPQGVQSNANQSKSVRDDGGNFERSSPNGVHSSTNNATRVITDGGSSERNSPDGVQSNRNQSRRIAADGGNFRRNSPASVQFNRNKSRSLATDDGNYERSDANAGNPQQNGGDGPSDGNSERIIANASDSQQNGSGDGAQGTEGVNSQLNVGSKQGCENPSKRGRGKLTRTELKMVPRSGRVQLEPSGDCQFKYVGYTPRGYKYPSQVGAILKREYPGIITVYDDDGTIVKQQPALSWNDYYWKKNEHGVCYAQRVKHVIWNLFTVHPNHRREAEKNLEIYLGKRVTNMIYQLRLESIKMFFHDKGEDCDDRRARTIELTEAEYLSARIEWCNKTVWAWFSKYWTSDEYKEKRLRAQQACMSSEDPAQNRGGSRNFTETQQFLEYTFGPGHQSGNINTFAVMKSGIKKMDSTGRSGPIPSHKAQKRLDDYKALAPDENSKVFDGKALYTMGRGMPHGRVLLGNGAVNKASVLVHRKSTSVMPPNHDEYQSVIAENEQLKETNELLTEENGVHRELLMRLYADFKKQPAADLLQRLANIDARRNQTTRSSHGGCESVDNDWYNHNYNDDQADENYTIEGANEDDYVDEEDSTDDEADEEDMSVDDALHEEDDHEANNLQNVNRELDDDEPLTDYARARIKKIRMASGTRHGNTNGSK